MSEGGEVGSFDRGAGFTGRINAISTDPLAAVVLKPGRYKCLVG